MSRLKSMLQLLNKVAQDEGSAQPLIVGGLPRDRLIANKLIKFNDVDVTTGFNTQHLAKEFAIKLQKYMPVATKQGEDGHISVYTKNIKLDFSSNFNTPGIVQILENMGIKHITPMIKEIYSRDFYCNTLLMSLDFKKIKDMTGEAVKDINDKKIRTCLTPDLTFKYNTKRIIRVIYLACKLGFDIEPSIIDWIRSNPHYLREVSANYISKNIESSMIYDPDRTAYLINEMRLWKYITISESLLPYYMKHTL